MKQLAVIGCGFGDEGKGKVVSSLCYSNPHPIVIRFCGGHQAGHHVVLPDGPDHVFSNFGSGTLQGVPTYWSKFCTVDPLGIINEIKILRSKKIDPILYIDYRCPVTTPFEKIVNIIKERSRDHGSCRVGVGQTYQREEDFYHLQFEDLYNETTLKIKLRMLREHYYSNYEIPEHYENQFLQDVRNLLSYLKIRLCRNEHSLFKNYETLIFEGSQGLLLDQHYGFFPHVSRGNFGTKNILEMGFTPEVFLVSRAYQTRHGNGPMTNEGMEILIDPNPYEHNFDKPPQGKFRTSMLDLGLLSYAIQKDAYIHSHCKNLVVTCLDLIKEYKFTYGVTCEFSNQTAFLDEIKNILKMEYLILSRTPYPQLLLS